MTPNGNYYLKPSIYFDHPPHIWKKLISEPAKSDVDWNGLAKQLRLLTKDMTESNELLIKGLKLNKKVYLSFFERQDAHLQLLNHKIDGLLLYPEQSVKVSQLTQAQREQLAKDLKQGMTDSFHSLEPDDGDNSSLSLPTRDEAVNAAVQRFAKEIAWEHSLHYLQKQVNVNGVLLEVTLGIVGDAVGNSNEPYQWPTTAKAGMSTDDTDKEIHHA